MKTQHIVFLVAVALFAGGCSKQPAKIGWSVSSTLDIGSEVSIDGVRSGMTIQQIIAALGQPTRTNAAGLEFSATGLFISPHIGEVVLFPPFVGRTKKGIGMGSSRADVIRAYGEPTSVAPTTKPAFVILRYESLGLRFQLHNDKVDWIAANSPPTE